MGRYDTAQLTENQPEPGSRGQVLKNLLGIKDKREMDRVEAEALKQATDTVIRTYDAQHRFTAKDICKIHGVWLEGIYRWAGRYRQVNVEKGGFPFASAAHIPKLMEELEQGPLREDTPCRSGPVEEVASALSVVHTELVLIHPFREGNGRVARLLASLMALQAGLPLLDFGLIKGGKRQRYFVAVQAGMKRDYRPMTRIFSEVIQKTLTGPARR
jgi:cell filamentation protein